MNDSLQLDVIRRIHDASHRAVLAVTGGGTGAISALAAVGGASRTLLEAVVPYTSAALVEWIGGRPEQFCSSHTARQMAMRAFRRAEQLRAAEYPESEPNTHVWPVVGVACTASLASDRPKRSPHRVHLAAQSATTTWSWSIELTKGARSREEEERVVAALLIALLAETCDLHDTAAGPELRPEEVVERRRTDAPSAWQELLSGASARTDVRPGFASPGDAPRALFPGSFNPLHDGHRQMAETAAAKLGAPVDFEISIENVEKPSLDFEEMARRAEQFDGRSRVWFTRAPRMKQKARLFPGVTIVCGVDTLLRVADARFAGGSEAERDRDLAEIADLGCRFLTFGRKTAAGFETADDVVLPEALRRLTTSVPESEFRADVSSTEVRGATGSDDR